MWTDEVQFCGLSFSSIVKFVVDDIFDFFHCPYFHRFFIFHCLLDESVKEDEVFLWRERDGDVEKMFDLRDDDVMLMILNP